jgi:methylglyoxal reductase
MNYHTLGISDLKISEIILGTWAIGGSHWGKYDEIAAVETIEAAIDNGVTTIDTAPAYGNGHAEKLIGGIIKNRREKVIIATKGGIEPARGLSINLSPAFLQLELDNSLRRLGTDYIDLYQCHWPDPRTPIKETMDFLMKKVDEKKIRCIGISNFRDNEIRESVKYAPIVSVQREYSLLERSIELEIQRTCIEKKLGFIAYGPLGGGVLTGKYKELPSFSSLDARTFFYKYYSADKWPRIRNMVETIQSIAQEKNCSPEHIAICWVLSRPGVSGVIVGARNVAQLMSNIKAVDVILSERDLKRLGEV